MNISSLLVDWFIKINALIPITIIEDKYTVENEALYNYFLTQDNNKELSTSISVSGCVDKYHALARAEEEVLISRYTKEYVFSIRNIGVLLEPGDIIKLSSETLKSDTDPIYIKLSSVKSNESGTVSLVGRTYHPGLLSWNDKENQVLMSKTYIPFTVEGPTNLVFNYSNVDIKVSIGKLSWDISQNSSINEYYVDAINTSTGAVITLGYTKDNYFSVPPLISGTYKFRVSGISISGRKSDPTEITTTITDGTETVVLFNTSDNLKLTTNGITTEISIDITSVLPSNCYYEVDIKESAESNWISLGQSFTPNFKYQNAKDQINYDIRVRIVHLYGKTGTYSTKQHFVIGKTAVPSNVASFGASQNNFGITLSWSEISDLDLSHYIIKKGTNWNNAEFVARTSEQYYLLDPLVAGTYTWLIKAVDTSGNESATATVASLSISGPSAVNSITSNLVRNLLTITWSSGVSIFPISEYRIYSSGSLISSLKSTTFSLEPNWSGAKTFDIVAVDIAGQESPSVSHSFTINPPAKVNNFRAQVIDNNILFYWDAVQGTLPTKGYRLKRGDTLATSTTIGELNALFTPYFESRAGIYTYYIAAIDSANNEGEYASFTAIVNQPPDYELVADYYSSYDGTQFNILEEGSQLFLPVNTSQTWSQHFTDNSKNTIEDFINNEYTIFIQPSVTSLTTDSYYEEIFDYGTILGNTKVTLTITGIALADNPELKISLATSSDGTTFSEYQAVSQLFATGFRAIKFKIELENTNDKALYRIDQINLVLDAKLKNDGGSSLVFATSNVTYSQTSNILTITQTNHGRIAGDYVDVLITSGSAISGRYKIDTVSTDQFTIQMSNSLTTSGNATLDTDGTPIELKQEFIDISSITVTPNAATPMFGLYTVLDEPNQHFFTILLFNTTGTRLDGKASWSVKGY